MQGYEFDFDGEYRYSFLSKSEVRVIELTAQFKLFHVGRNIYNFEFGVLDKDKGVIDTSVVINNGDPSLIIATVAYIIEDFISTDKTRVIRFCGSNTSRTRLFLIWISFNFDELMRIYSIYGYRTGRFWSPYKKNIKYESILIVRK